MHLGLFPFSIEPCVYLYFQFAAYPALPSFFDSLPPVPAIKHRQTKTSEQIRNPVIRWTTLTVQVGHVGLQQAQVGQGFIVETLKVDVLQPESNQDVTISLQPIRVTSLQDRVNYNFSHGSSTITLFRMQEKVEESFRYITVLTPRPHTCHNYTLWEGETCTDRHPTHVGRAHAWATFST